MLKLPPPKLRIKLENGKARDDVQFILVEASPNALIEINSHSHALSNISIPLSRGVDIRQHERSLTAFPSIKSFGDFQLKDKARNALK